MDITLEFVGSKWKILILWNVRNGAQRFSELRKHIPNITEKMLSLQLKQLEADHFISREVFAEVPPRVEYTLTDEGKTLLPMLEAMSAWGEQKAKKTS
ncbi:MAG: MarR family transcriptional regulator [Candidatus Kapaibacterium sp.]|nr:MAG: MarR family transcriptional regulator [Candidatus Kapabacteria bacterium]